MRLFEEVALFLTFARDESFVGGLMVMGWFICTPTAWLHLAKGASHWYISLRRAKDLIVNEGVSLAELAQGVVEGAPKNLLMMIFGFSVVENRP